MVQHCKWKFLLFKGSFAVKMRVQERPDEMQLLFAMEDSSFMRDFEGRWKVSVVGE